MTRRRFAFTRSLAGPRLATNNPAGKQPTTTKRKGITFGSLPRPGAEASDNTADAPSPVVNPPSRADTTSAASTVYVVRHNADLDAPQPVRLRPGDPIDTSDQLSVDEKLSHAALTTDEEKKSNQTKASHWHGVSNPWKRKRAAPPAEVEAAITASSDLATSPNKGAARKPHADLKGRLGAFAAKQGDKFKDRAAGRQEVELPWTVIPAQPRGAAAWSPDLLSKSQDGRTPSPSNDPTTSSPRQDSTSSSETEPSSSDPRSSETRVAD